MLVYQSVYNCKSSEITAEHETFMINTNMCARYLALENEHASFYEANQK